MFFFLIFFFLIFFLQAYIIGTHLNCIDKSMQFKWVLTTYAFIDKKYTVCNLKTTELLDYILIGVCAVIRSNKVFLSGSLFITHIHGIT